MKDSAYAVLHLMERLDGACAEDFAEHIHTSRYSARIKELRDLGYIVQRELCTRHGHRHRLWLYRLVASPQADGQVALAVGTGR